MLFLQANRRFDDPFRKAPPAPGTRLSLVHLTSSVSRVRVVFCLATDVPEGVPRAETLADRPTIGVSWANGGIFNVEIRRLGRLSLKVRSRDPSTHDPVVGALCSFGECLGTDVATMEEDTGKAVFTRTSAAKKRALKNKDLCPRRCDVSVSARVP